MNFNLNDLDAILFDFGNTIADEFYFRKGNKEAPNFPSIMKSFLYDPYYADPCGDNLLNRWMSGKIDSAEIAQLTSKSTDLPVDVILQLMNDNCSDLIVFHKVLSWAKKISKTKKTAIVTINADIFSKTIVKAYSLDKIFPVIVNSCNLETLDKVVVCQKALQLLGNIPPEKSLLIDNTIKCCDDFKAYGGNSYLFEGEEKFVSDFLL